MNNRSYRYLIYSLFLLSGISGLIYQIVWTRMLVLVFGNTMLATSTVLSAFMGGLAAGSYALGRYIDKKPRPLIIVYAYLEAGIGIFGLLFPFILSLMTPLYIYLYSSVGSNIVMLNLIRFLVCFIIIVIPTFLMGGTLPVLIKRFTSSDKIIGQQTGFLYGLNTVGAVLGTVACGYFMLKILGMQMTTWVAVAINLGVAVIAWIIGKGALEKTIKEKLSTIKQPLAAIENIYSRNTIRMVLIGIGLSGFCALAYEVFWTRMLNLFLHNNIYSFTAILATFLIGIALGSLFYARFLSKSSHQMKIFIWLQVGICSISYATPYIFKTFHSTLFNNFNEAMTLAKTSVIMIGPTIMMGIAVPLAIQICQKGMNKEGTSVGSVYAINTIGAILGAFIAGFVLLPLVGLHIGIIIVAGLNLLAAFLPLFSITKKKIKPAWSIAFVLIVLLMVMPASTNLFKSLFQNAHPNAEIVHYKEGKVANILVYDFKKLGYKDFHLNAVNEASSRIWHVQLFKMLGLLPTLVHENPSDALMIAFGAGMSAGATAKNVESLDVVDLNPDIEGIAEAFTRENLDVINQPNFTQIVNDGRNELMLNPRKYSLIISDATNPKMFDSWTLYSKEFYQLVKERLKPGGVFCQWALIPLPGDAIKTITKTFRSVFPHTSLWVIHGSTQILFLATPERLEIDYEDLKSRLEPHYEKTGLAEFGIDSIEKFLSFFILGEDGIDRMLKEKDKISTDDLPHAQFYIEQDDAGIDNCLDIVRYQESILSYIKNPDSLPEEFVEKMNIYQELSRRLNIAFLLEDPIKFAEAEVIAYDAGLKDANVAHHLNYCPEKKRHFINQLDKFPDDVTARNWLGNIYLKEREFHAAEKEFELTLKQKPDHSFAKINLAMSQLEIGKFDEAIENLLIVKKLNPTKKILNAVNIQLEKIRLLRKLEIDPESVELNYNLAQLYYKEGNILDAVINYRKVLELSSYDLEILNDYIKICENHEFINDLTKYYRILANSNPSNNLVNVKSVQYSMLVNDADNYKKWLNDRLVIPDKINSNDLHPSTCDEALTLWNDVDPDGSAEFDKLVKAADLYKSSANSNPDDLHAYIDAAILYEVSEKYDRAIEMWEKLYQVRQDASIKNKHIPRLQSLKSLNNNNNTGLEKALLLQTIAGHYVKMNELELAIEYLNQAVEIFPNESLFWINLSELYFEIGSYKKANDANKSALKLDPENIYSLKLKEKISKIN